MTTASVSEVLDLAPTRRRVSRGLILVLGVVIIPTVLALALNSWGPLTADSAFRMAAATVAGQTIAILSAIVALGITIKRGYGPAGIIAFGLIAVLVTAASLSSIASAGELLFTRLDLVRETNLLNS